MLFLAFLLILVAIVLFWQAGRRQKALGLPAGRVIYSDTQKWKRGEQAFYDPELGLTGRPDYIIEQGDQLIPVEVKSSRVETAPYDSHIFQLAVYCLLIQRSAGKRPPYGILHYPNHTFAVDFTPELETELLELLASMRQMERRKEVPRSHQETTRCRACGFREICDQRL